MCVENDMIVWQFARLTMKFPESYNGGSVGREGNSTWKSRVKRRVEEKRDREKEREPRVEVGGRRRTARGAMATWSSPLPDVAHSSGVIRRG